MVESHGARGAAQQQPIEIASNRVRRGEGSEEQGEGSSLILGESLFLGDGGIFLFPGRSLRKNVICAP